MRKIINRIFAFSFAMVFALFGSLSFYCDVFAVEKMPTINIGQKNIAVKIKYMKGFGEQQQEIVENLKSDKDGIVVLDNLYQYCKELNWQTDSSDDNIETGQDDTGDGSVPAITEIKINYEINYPEKKPAEKDELDGGDGKYTDAKGDYSIKYDEDWCSEKKIEIKEIDFVHGKAVYQKTNNSTVPCEEGKIVKIDNKTIEVHNGGEFTGYPELEERDYEDKEIFVEGNDEYNDYKEKYSDFAKKHIATLTERKSPSKSDYSYGKDISDNGFVSGPGEYVINGENGSTLSLNRNDHFSDTVIVNIDESGKSSPIYVKRSNGDITKPVEQIIKLDQSDPIIEGIDVVRETKNDFINFLKHGIYAKTFADLTIEMRVSDTGSGVNNIYIEGTDKTTGEKIKYTPVDIKKNNNSYNLAFEIKGDDFKILESVLKIIAKDKVGNESELRLVRANEAASTLTLEKIKPLISNIKIEGTKSENNWYNSPVKVKFDVQDKESGLYNIVAKVNGKELYSKEFTDSKNTDVNSLSFDITTKEINSLINADSSYDIAFTVTDNSGNMTTSNDKVQIDIVKPNVTLSGIKKNGNYNKTPSLNIKNDEKHYTEKGAFIYLKVLREGKEYFEKKYEQKNDVDYKGFKDNGKYDITTYAVDAAGNKSSEKKISFIKDNVKPLLKINNINGKKKNGWYSTETEVNISAFDGISGLSEITAVVNGKNKLSKSFEKGNKDNKNYSFTISRNDIKSLMNQSGSYEISLTAVDKAGNLSKINKTIHIDIVKPNVTLSGIKYNKHYGFSPTLNIRNDEKHYKSDGAFINVKVYRDGKNVKNGKYNMRNSLNYSSFGKDGNYRVQVYAKDAAGNHSATKTISFVKDSTKPHILLTGVKQSAIYKTAKTVRVSVNERYYKTNKVKITVSKKLNGNINSINFPWTNNGKETSHSKTFDKTGVYTIKVSSVDEAGNKADSKTISFTIDNEKPKISISDISNKAYGKKAIVAPVIKIYDDFYKSKTITLTRNGNTVNNIPYSFKSSSKGGKATYKNFTKKEKNDGVYKLVVRVSDKAGNTSSKSVVFSVNRFGSTFKYNDALRKLIAAKYSKEVPEDFVIKEYNISKVNSSVDDIKLDGTSSNIKTVLTKAEESNYKLYTHKYPAKKFNQEGIYSINIVSTDSLGNISESRKKAGKISFAIDRTAPNVTLSKEINGKAFDAESIDVKAQITDSISPASVKVSVNGNEVVNEKFKGNSGNVSFTVPKGRNNKVEISTNDLAGNTKTFTYNNVTVSTNWFTRLTGNYLFYAGIAVFLFAAAGSGLLLYKKKKH